MRNKKEENRKDRSKERKEGKGEIRKIIRSKRNEWKKEIFNKVYKVKVNLSLCLIS
jgi:hypothetical protein